MTNKLIQRVGDTMFNLLLVDDWLMGLFYTNNDVWRFLEYLGRQLEAGEEVPNEIYIFTVATTGTPDVAILEIGKVIKTPTQMPDETEKKDRFVYTAIHEGPEWTEKEEIVRALFPQIMEALYEPL